jgi:hypothetical protein
MYLTRSFEDARLCYLLTSRVVGDYLTHGGGDRLPEHLLMERPTAAAIPSRFGERRAIRF